MIELDKYWNEINEHKGEFAMSNELSDKKYKFDAYSWLEISEMDKKGQTILIPLGSVEEAGSHLPMGADIYVAEAIANEVAKKTGCLVGPSIPIGYSEWFLEFPGTISLKMETFIQVLRDYCSSLIRHGFNKIIFVNGHGGHAALVGVVARELVAKHDVQIAMVEPWIIANSLGQDILGEKTFTHAGELMTSLMLYLHPQEVNMQRAKVEYSKSRNPSFKTRSIIGPAEFKGVLINHYEKAKDLTASGTTGDPLSATAKKGELLFEKITAYLVEMVRNFGSSAN
jgi:creatinine amidohydrolase